MARPGIFDTDAVPWGWFDECGQDQGWFDRDLLTYPAVVPPPPPPPPPPTPPAKRRRRHKAGGGNAVFVNPGVLPDELCRYYYYTQPEIEKEQKEEEADYALVHVTEGAVVRALAAGRIELMLDGKGRRSVVLEADDGTRYWYANVSESVVDDGARVLRDQPIARAKSNAPPVPTITVGGPKPAALPHRSGDVAEAPPAASPPRLPPAQVVFVEAPPTDHEPPRQPLTPPLQIFKLVKVAEATPPPPSPSTGGVILRTVARVGVVAAILYALSFLVPKKKPPLPRLRKKKRKRRPARRRRW